MQIVVFQCQQVLFIDVPVELHKGVPCLLLDIDGAVLLAGGEPELVMHDAVDPLDIVL